MKIFWLILFVSAVIAETVDDAPLTPEDKVFWDRFLKVDALSAPVTPPAPPPMSAPVVPCNPQVVECCVTSDCDNPAINVCEANVCIGKGNPRFTLTWSGEDDLDIHVMTPGGFEIYFDAEFDPVSGGILDNDDIPEVNALWVENIIFPLDGSAPRGTYTYFVVNYNQTDAADAWTLEVFLGDTLRATHNGVVAEGGNANRFTFDF